MLVKPKCESCSKDEYDPSFLVLKAAEEQMGPRMCYQASFQHYAGKCSTTIWSGGGPFVALANFHGVNTPNHDGFQATSLTPFVWSRETQRHTLSKAFTLHGDNRDK